MVMDGNIKQPYIYKISGCLLAMLKGDVSTVPYRVQNDNILQTCLFANIVDIRIL